MNRIHVLPDNVARKIAAGEVVERPVSVVKELVENSLDAGAAEIRVELQAGGKALILVQDDGCGMSPDDAALCFRRHSTSKITSEDDLERIATLGFRGEALASISAVSRVVLRTSDGTSGRGLKLEREGERITGVTEVAFPRGTGIEVRDLFFNLPARRKFLRSDQSEMTLVAKYMTQTALAFPRVRFILVHGTRVLIDCPAVTGLSDRIFQLYGKDVLDRLMEIGTEEDGRRLDGYASLPLAGRGDRSVQHFFVNNRPVKDRTLLAALGQAYSGLLEKGRSPECFLFISLPCGEVDVNVHPAKTEVRFRDSQAVFRLVLRAVGAAVGRGPMVKGVQTAAGTDSSASGRGLEASMPGLFTGAPEPVVRPFGGPAREADHAAGAGPYERPFGSVGEKGPDAGEWEDADGAAAVRPAGPVVLGQYDNLYIIAVSSDGLMVIDQHNAHERVLFEKFQEIDRAGQWPRTMMLVPEVMDLSPAESLKFDENGLLLEELGFRADRMGGRTVALKEYPAIFGPKAARETFMSFLGERTPGDLTGTRVKMLATMACKSAIKAGQPLTPEQMLSLVAELFKTRQPALCPHGRPVVLKIDKSNIERELGRPVRPGRE